MRLPKTAFPLLLFSFQIVFAQADNQVKKLEDKSPPNEIPKIGNIQPELKWKPKEIRVGVVNKRARYIPKPGVARDIKATGEVKVEIKVDMNGKVTFAKAVSGNPLLYPAAEASARRTRFAPTLIDGGPPIIVVAYLVYNFKSRKVIEF